VAALAARYGREPLVRPLDVRDLAAVQRVYSGLKQAWGRVEVVFYNAGGWSLQNVEAFNAETAVNELEVNLVGMARVLGTVIPDMVAQREGEIIGTASVAGYAGLPGAAAYSASKAGANVFLQSLRMDLKPYDVGVTTVNPGFVRTTLAGRSALLRPIELTAEQAAARIVKGLLAGEAEIHFPKLLSWPWKLATALPRPVYEALAPYLAKGR
jgi:short-subunit dehydrogenase